MNLYTSDLMTHLNEEIFFKDEYFIRILVLNINRLFPINNSNYQPFKKIVDFKFLLIIRK
jgi:hypothetical protein